MRNIIISHPTGNANVKALTAGLQKAGLLYRFYTAIAIFPGRVWDWLSRIKSFSAIRSRYWSFEFQKLTQTRPWLELGRLLAQSLGWKYGIRPEKGFFSIDHVYQDLDRQVASVLAEAQKKGIKGVYAYEDGALESFRKAQALGLLCLYDLPIGYWRSARSLLTKEQNLRPEWAMTIGGLNDSDAKLTRKEAELQLADHIFVASTFTAKTLKDFPGKLAPVSVIPYGFPPVYEDERKYYPQHGKKLQLLFVGGLSQRKGVAHLFEAVAGLEEQVELTIVGHKPYEPCDALEQELKKHCYIPSLPHEEILVLMRSHDVLVFPSLFEGFGLVITEAMSQGTPVITTERTAGPDLIRHGENGWLVAAGNTQALRAQLEFLLQHPEAIARNGEAARANARQRPWSAYGEEMSYTITQLLENR